MVHTSPSSVIARAVDAYRIRRWLKSPRCPCRCGERIPWSSANADAFEKRRHIPTVRRPHQGACSVESKYIPSTVENFRSYIVERRHVIRTYSAMLWQYCLTKGEDWVLTLLSNGHATRLWQLSRSCAWQTPDMVIDLVKSGWLEAANRILSWSTTADAFKPYYMDCLVRKGAPYDSLNRFTRVQRNWILDHPAMAEKTRTLHAQRRWTSLYLWTGLVKSWMRQRATSRVPLPKPCMENVPALILRLKSLLPGPGSQQYTDMLAWVAFLAKESPALLRRLLPILPRHTQWCIDVVETVATTGRVALLHERLHAFQRSADLITQREKIWQWATMQAFAIPRIVRSLLYIGCGILQTVGEDRRLGRKLLLSPTVIATIDHIAEWLSKKMPDFAVLNLGRKKSCPAIASAIQTTSRFRSLQQIAIFRATVYLTLFFKRHVHPEKARTVYRGDCPVCWTPKILHPLHGDKRHGVCHRCIRRLQHKNMLDRCPLCRTDL
jgi:hypothetical protein